jgi:uncharacterized protein
MSLLKNTLTEAMKDAMRARDKERLGTIRLILSECKQIEVDERVELDDTRVLGIMDKMLKQRRESIEHFRAAGRDDLVAIEEAEMVIVQGFMPDPLSEADVREAIAVAIQEVGAEKMQDMGKVMALLKPALQGRTDLSKVSIWVKEQLA